MKKFLILIIAICIFITGCGDTTKDKTNNTKKEKKVVVETIDSEDVKKIVDDYINYPEIDIIDVREEEEYQEGHIEGSINIPLSHINEINISLDRELIVYCESGNRSHQAAIQLINMGYKVKDMGGIKDWNYELEK